MYVGAKTFDYSMGADFGIFCLTNTTPVTEIEALKILCGVEAKHVASGGIGGSEGSVVIVVVGEEANVKRAIALVEGIKGEKPTVGVRGVCESCRYACRFAGVKEADLPAWLQSGAR